MKRIEHGSIGRQNIILGILLFRFTPHKFMRMLCLMYSCMCYKLRSENGLIVVFDSLGVQLLFHLHHRIVIVWSP
jgi:hypothetical protein